MGTWVRLKSVKHLEILGKLKKHLPGDWVEVGKQTALKWVTAGEAEIQPLGVCSPARARKLKPQAEQAGSKLRGQVEPRAEVKIPEPDRAQGGEAESATPEAERRDKIQTPAFTLFAVPMTFQHEHVTKQNNAIGSWTLLEPRPMIFLFGEEPGIADAAKQYGCLHLPRLTCNEFGTPVVGDAFRQAQMLAAPDDVICYVNSDIILLQDFADALVTAAERFEQFLMVGQRWDVKLRHPLALRDGWQERLRKLIASKGKRHSVGAIDYFAFRPGLYGEIPPFVIGRSCWDNWLVADVLRKGVAVVDASEAATVVHQDKGSTDSVITEERLVERRRNRALYDADRAPVTGKISNAGWVMDSDRELTERGKGK